MTIYESSGSEALNKFLHNDQSSVETFSTPLYLKSEVSASTQQEILC